MDISQNTAESAEFMVEKIKDKLKMMNMGAVKSTNFNEEMYQELREIYEMVMRKKSFSPSEMLAIAEELGKLRK